MAFPAVSHVDRDGNFYVGDYDWQRVLVFKAPFNAIALSEPTPTPNGTTRTPTPSRTRKFTPSPTPTPLTGNMLRACSIRAAGRHRIAF
jgi:hypothetical protein